MLVGYDLDAVLERENADDFNRVQWIISGYVR